jgi:hypothetical protein
MINNAPWFVPNAVILRDLQKPTVKEEIRRFRPQYGALLSAHPNDLGVKLMAQPDDNIYHTICLRLLGFDCLL